jgi:hypothetical protein
VGANFHGVGTYHCYHDCRMEGCPGHRIRVGSKHGGYFVEYLNEENQPLGNNGGRFDIGDICLINTVAEILRPNSGEKVES